MEVGRDQQEDRSLVPSGAASDELLATSLPIGRHGDRTGQISNVVPSVA
ncbi:hypothetical protein [Propionicimonas paludicola]|nr:hypothetical protein [Propionicimonas paludicola]